MNHYLYLVCIAQGKYGLQPVCFAMTEAEAETFRGKLDALEQERLAKVKTKADMTWATKYEATQYVVVRVPDSPFPEPGS